MTHKLGMAHSIAWAGPQDWCCWQMAPGEGCRGGEKEMKQEDGMRKAGGAPGRRLMQSCATNALQLSCCKGTMAGRSLLRWTTARQRAGVARMCERCKHLQLAHGAAGDTHDSAQRAAQPVAHSRCKGMPMCRPCAAAGRGSGAQKCDNAHSRSAFVHMHAPSCECASDVTQATSSAWRAWKCKCSVHVWAAQQAC